MKCWTVGPNPKCLLMTSLKLQTKGFFLFLRDKKSYSTNFSGRLVQSHFCSYFIPCRCHLASFSGRGSQKNSQNFIF